MDTEHVRDAPPGWPGWTPGELARFNAYMATPLVGVGHNGGPLLEELARPTESPQRKGRPRYAIIPADFVDDPRVKEQGRLSHYRVLIHLGRWTDKAGWFVRSGNQTRHARDIGMVRQSFNEAVGDLVEWGYVERIGCAGGEVRYRVIMDPAKRARVWDLSPPEDTDDADLSCGDDSNLSSADDSQMGEGLSPPDDMSSPDDSQPVVQQATAPVASAATPYSDLPSTTSTDPPIAPQRAAGGRRPTTTYLPEEWALSAEDRTWAREHAPQLAHWIDDELAAFMDRHRSRRARRADWSATWRDWWRGACERARRHPQSRGAQQPLAAQRRLGQAAQPATRTRVCFRGSPEFETELARLRRDDPAAAVALDSEGWCRLYEATA